MSQGELVIKRTFRNVGPEQVYKAWTDPATIVQWYGPAGMRIEIHNMDVKVGGSYRLTMHAPDGAKHVLRGAYQELTPPSSLVFTWAWEGQSEQAMPGSQDTRVSVAIKPNGADTIMTLTHSGFGSDDAVAQHQMGWDSTMPKLESLLAA